MPMQAGEFWLADIPFTDGSGTKIRPVLVLWIDGLDAAVAAVTSAAPRTPSDVVVREWQASGLRVPSTVRLARIDCLDQSLLFRRIGVISKSDGQVCKSAWDAHVKPRF